MKKNDILKQLLKWYDISNYIMIYYEEKLCEDSINENRREEREGNMK